MKKILLGLLALSSLSAFADEGYRICDNVFNTEVCSTVTEYTDGSVKFSNFAPDIQSVRSFAKTACNAAQITGKYKVKISIKKSCNYLAMKGTNEGKMVDDCNVSGRNLNVKVISSFECKVNTMQPVRGWH